MPDDDNGWLLVWGEGEDARCAPYYPADHAYMIRDLKRFREIGHDVRVYQAAMTYTRIEVVT